jgi:signal transduction histidine kinase
MSATGVAPATSSQRSEPPARGRVYYIGVSFAGLALLAMYALTDIDAIISRPLELLPWTILLMVVHLFPLSGRLSAHLTVDQPVATAAALVLDPVQIGVVALLGSFDAKELRGRIGLTKALFNRVQTAVTYVAGSAAVHAIATSPESSPYVILLAVVALSVQTLTNYLLVATALSIEYASSLWMVARELRLGTLSDFWLSFMAGSILGAMLAALSDQVHPLTILAFAVPVLLARQALKRSQMFIDTFQAYRSRELVLNHLSERIHEERSDERRLIAADLHDEVLQPLFKVSLLAHVLKADLATGRLLAMDEDVPQLVTAAELASNSLRELIGDLRRSALGRGGLSSAIRNLLQSVKKQTRIEIKAEVEVVYTDAAKELIIYQLAKEALANAVSHSRATRISLALRQDSNGLYLSVADDGVGFDPSSAKEGHFGLHIMKERVDALGGCLTLDSTPGRGSEVTVYVPPDGS